MDPVAYNPFGPKKIQFCLILSTKEDEKLVDIVFNMITKIVLVPFPNLTHKVVRRLFPFVSTYFCEYGFVKYY